MRNILFLLSLSIIPLYAYEDLKKPVTQEKKLDVQQLFEIHKDQLPIGLKTFLNDFETWPKEDKAKISIRGLSFMISDLNKEKHTPYGGNIGYWIDCRT